MSKINFGSIIQIKKGTKIESLEEYVPEAIRFIQIDDLRNDNNIKYCLPSSKYTFVDQNDLIIAWDGANAGTIGYGLKGAIGSTLAQLHIKSNDYNSRFLGYLLKHKFSYLRENCTGATIPHINRQSLDRIAVPVLSYEIQEKIACTLDKVSELLALRKRQLEELDVLIQSIFYEMFGDPVLNEKGWVTKKLTECCLLNPKKSDENIKNDLEVSFVPMAKVSEKGRIDVSESKIYSDVKTGFTYFAENDVLFAKITPCMENGKGAVARHLKNNIGFGSTEFHIFRPIDGISNSEWLYRLSTLSYFRTLAEKNMSGSAGQKRVPSSFFGNISIPLPPIELQNKFANIAQKIEEEKQLIQKSIDETQLLFDSLMSQYFD